MIHPKIAALQVLLSLILTFCLAATARAEKQLNLTVSAKVGQSFSSLVQEAEALAKSTANQVFSTQAGVSELSLNILGDNNGELVPLLSVKVLRDDWQSNSILAKVKYFNSANLLIGARKVNYPAVARNPTPYNPNSEPNFY